MLDFIIVGLPRSGTTFAANMFCTESVICWHDNLGYMTPEEIDNRKTEKKYKGIADSGAWLFPEWVEKHVGKVLILERNISEINQSLIDIGMNKLSKNMIDKFNSLNGYRVDYKELFNNPKNIWEFLIPDVPFDIERHTELLKMNIQPTERAMIPDVKHIHRLLTEFSIDFQEMK